MGVPLTHCELPHLEKVKKRPSCISHPSMRESCQTFGSKKRNSENFWYLKGVAGKTIAGRQGGQEGKPGHDLRAIPLGLQGWRGLWFLLRGWQGMNKSIVTFACRAPFDCGARASVGWQRVQVLIFE